MSGTCTILPLSYQALSLKYDVSDLGGRCPLNIQQIPFPTNTTVLSKMESGFRDQYKIIPYPGSDPNSNDVSCVRNMCKLCREIISETSLRLIGTGNTLSLKIASARISWLSKCITFYTLQNKSVVQKLVCGYYHKGYSVWDPEGGGMEKKSSTPLLHVIIFGSSAFWAHVSICNNTKDLWPWLVKPSYPFFLTV